MCVCMCVCVFVCAVKGGWVGGWVHSEHLHKKLFLRRPGYNRGEREGQRVWVGLALWLIA